MWTTTSPSWSTWAKRRCAAGRCGGACRGQGAASGRVLSGLLRRLLRHPRLAPCPPPTPPRPPLAQVKKLADIRGSAAAAGMDVSVPDNTINRGTRGGQALGAAAHGARPAAGRGLRCPWLPCRSHRC